MIDHLGISVRDYEASRAFYLAALAPIGYGLLMELTVSVAGRDVAGFGDVSSRHPDFWLSRGEPQTRLHVAFRASDRAQVRAFYDEALRAGARDNGAPAIRAHYHPNYYGAFVLDLDGHNIEVVCHRPE